MLFYNFVDISINRLVLRFPPHPHFLKSPCLRIIDHVFVFLFLLAFIIFPEHREHFKFQKSACVVFMFR